MKFEDLLLCDPLLRALVVEGYTTPTPIQEQSIPHVLAGRDLLGCAQTGTGKTAAFALPILQLLSQNEPGYHGHARKIRALVLSPTRELALQISESFRAYGRHTTLRRTVVYGGVNQNPQTRALKDGVDILVATPGRLHDLMNQGFVDLRNVEIFVLDEADRMLDMGFINDIRKVVAKLPRERQTLFFSATMPRDIRALADTILKNPVSVQVAPTSATADKIDQSVYFVEKRNKPELLAHLLFSTPITRGLVFTRTKHGADRVVRHLLHAGVRAEAIHGDKTQGLRQRALGNFQSGKTPVLVATDIAARGLDIDEISHVINFDVPNSPETYVHRIGRTARAGASGIAISFCDGEERSQLKAIERLLKTPLQVKTDHPQYAVRQGPPAQAGASASTESAGGKGRSGAETRGRGEKEGTRGGHRRPGKSTGTSGAQPPRYRARGRKRTRRGGTGGGRPAMAAVN